MAQITKPVPGFPAYAVSPEGAVFGQKGQLLKLDKTKGGYLRFRPLVNGKMHMMLVHRAVALAFIGDPPDEERIFIGHQDGNPANNQVENLKWVTYEENWEDRKRHGNDGRGVQNGRSKMTQEKADELRRLYAAGDCTYS